MDIQNKICVLTGPTSGIGKAAAEKFAGAGCNLILVARNRHRAEKLADELIRKTGNERITLFTSDFSSLREIKELSEMIHSAYDRIDILINNAGAYFSKFHKTMDGIEASFQVNYLSRFLLTNLLLDLILKSEGGRIINVSGEHYRKGKFDILVRENNNYSGLKGAQRAKFADMVFVFELARRLEGTNVKINAVHPGSVSTCIIENDPDATVNMKLLYSLCRPFFRGTHKAADDLYYIAFSEELDNITGKYFYKNRFKEPLVSVYDRETALKLWDLSEELTNYRNTLFKNNKLIME